MFEWLERNSPLQAMCPWCLSVGAKIGHFEERFQFDGWIQETNGRLHPRAVYEKVGRLHFEHECEADPTAIKLDLPYISQYDETAGTHRADCGPASMAMILNANKATSEHVTVDELYARHLPDKAPGAFTLVPEMLQIGRGEGLDVERINYPNAGEALDHLRALVSQNTPFVVLVNYDKWKDDVGNTFAGGHFVAVAGFGQQHVWVHDPLFAGAQRSRGAFFAWSNEQFLDAWGSCHENGNLDFTAVVPDKRVARL